MSLSFRNELRIVLCPDKVIILGLSKGWRRKVQLQVVLPCEAEPGMPSWQPAVSVLGEWLAANAAEQARAMVTLSSRFVRYAVLPWSEETSSRSEDEALVRILFEEVYGDIAQDWQFAIAEGGYGETRLAAAVESPLLDAVRQMLAQSGISLNSCKPYFIHALNAFLKQVREPDGLLIVIEAGHAVLLLVRDGKLNSVRQAVLNGDGALQLSNMLHRELLLGGLIENEIPVYLHSPEDTLNLQQANDFSVQELRLEKSSKFELVDDIRFNMGCVE